MNEQTEVKRDDLHDRLMDLALEEKLGGKRPPDIGSRLGPRIPQEKSARRAFSSYKLAIAAMLLVSASVAGIWALKNRAQRSADELAIESSHDEHRQLEDRVIKDIDVLVSNARQQMAVSPAPILDELKRKELFVDRALELSPEVRAKLYEKLAPAIREAQRHIAVNDQVDAIAQHVASARERHHVSKPQPDALADTTTTGRRGPRIFFSDVPEEGEQPNVPAIKPSKDATLHVWLGPDGKQIRGPFDVAPPADESRPPEGRGPEQRGDQHASVIDNALRRVVDEPLSTFSIDVDTAAYSKVRSLLNNPELRQLPRLDWLRVEEMINYFGYDYPAPRTGEPFSVNIETAACPWAAGRRLVRIGLKGREIDRRERPAGNFVVLLDVSGSMQPANKLPLVLEGMRLLTGQLNEQDRVAIVVYAGASGLVLPSTPATHEGKREILSALSRLHSGGSTNGAAGIELAYQMAQDHFIKGGANRVILCTDGDFNVGVTSPDRLESLITEKAKTGVFLTTLGFGMGNHNDAMLEKLADKGNGVYGYIDTIDEAKKLFVEELSGTLVTVAKDVKIQVEFNPVHVAAYRLIGYENRVLAKEDFNDDKKDAGEIGAGHTVTALYEIVPAALLDKPAVAPLAPKVDDLEFQKPGDVTDAARESGQTLVVKLRYKEPDGDTSKLIKVGVKDDGNDFSRATVDFKFATAVASFGMLLRDSPYKGNATFDSVLEIARSALGKDQLGYRAELVRLVEQAKSLGR